MSSRHSLRLFVEQEFGKVPHFVIYAILEWTLISILFLDGLLALFSFEFAEFFDLRPPCVLCTRIDHILMRKKGRSNYNESICEGHKKNLSSVAYCHVHGKLADIRRMCEGCLLTFATDNKSDCDVYKSITRAVTKDIEGLVDDEMKNRIISGKGECVESGNDVCSCCGEALKKAVKSQGFQKTTSCISRVSSRISQGPAPSPRAAFASWRAEDARNTLEMTQIRCQELKLHSNSTLEDDDPVNVVNTPAVKEEPKSARAPPLPEHDDFNMEDSLRTPSFTKSIKFLNLGSESAASSPRFANRMPRKSLLEKVELASDPVEAITGNETDTKVILDRLKNQVRTDRKSLIALYMELDEERGASAVAANNAMAMITRLQAEKAAVQMEALQYQRMMEEQAEYDQEAIQMLRELLNKREDEITDLESELDLYKDRYGIEQVPRGKPLDRYQSFEKSDLGSPLPSVVAPDIEMVLDDNDGGQVEEEDDDFDGGGESH